MKDEKQKPQSRPQFIRNADIRAGKIPGWPSKQGKDNGDPYDPNNMARTNAHVIINDGTVARNTMSAHVAQYVAKRRVAVFIFMGLLAGFSLFNYEGLATMLMPESAAGTQKTEQTNKAGKPALSSADGEAAAALIETYYVKQNPIAKDYELGFLSEKMEWPAYRKYTISYLSKGDIERFENMDDAQKKYAFSHVRMACGGKVIPDCLMRRSGTELVAALTELGEKPSAYIGKIVNDTKEPVAPLEEILVKFKEQFPKTASSYCDSENRFYADTWHFTQTQKSMTSLKRTWEAGKFDPAKWATEVKSMRELLAHRVDGDAECKNPNFVIYKVGGGALKYMLSVKTRAHISGKNRVASQLFFLAELDDKPVVARAACANCGDLPGLNNEPSVSLFISSLTSSGNAVKKAFEKSGFSLAAKGE